ncbi:hypothetical protein EV175_001002 [Coemansia sp. RSA 1933]|nr:hypothetical protein EV175_001002 [Coemansia sp. RSA 1933]
MSWLQRNLFSRKRTASQAEDNQKNAEKPTETASTQQRLDNEKPAVAPLHRATLTYNVRAAESDTSDSEEGGDAPGDASKEEENVDELFSRLSIADVRQYERTLQGHVERIQRRMRRVATKHYHDLINAADSVVAMDASSVSISKKLVDLKSMLDNASAVTSGKGGTGVTSKTEAETQEPHEDAQAAVYAAAAQIKVLIDTPEQIWKALGARHFLQAALLYLIACKIHQRLSAEHRASTPSSGRSRSGVGDNPLPAFPVVERQWAAIASFRDQITAKAHQLLETADGVSIEATASAICAIALLEDVDAEMACTLFLTRRGQSLAPLLERIGAFSGDTADLPVLLQELLGHVWQILADFVIVFGVPDDEADPMYWRHGTDTSGGTPKQRYASWMLTTLASLSADTDLPVSPTLQPLWQDKSPARTAIAEKTKTKAAAATGTPESAAGSETSKAPPRRLRSGRGSSSGSIRSRRRKSSIAGSVLSTTLAVSPLSESFHFDTLRSPITPTDRTRAGGRPQSIAGGGGQTADWVGAHALSDTKQPWQMNAQPGSRTSGMFIISKYLPEEIAQYRPPLARILDAEAVHADSAAVALDEAAEEDDDHDSGLERFLDNPRTLLDVLASQIQPRMERTAADALGLWWTNISANMSAAVACAIERRVLSVGEAAQVGAAMHRWESADTRCWLRGFSPVAIGGNAVLGGMAAHGSSLYEALVEPLLRSRARMLLCAATDRTLAIVDGFVQSAVPLDVAAGALPWRPLPLGGGTSRSLDVAGDADMSISNAPAMDELAEDIRGAVNAEPAAASALRQAVSAGLQQPWRNGEHWWVQISGQAAFAEAMECCRHFERQWRAMTDRLDHWAARATTSAHAVLESAERASVGSGQRGDTHVPAEVLLCLKGAWAASALAAAAHDLASDATPALVRECWQQLGITPASLGDSLQTSSGVLLEPWLHFLGSSMALAWAADFDVLYYTIPHALRADAAATRSDIIQAWTAVSQPTEQLSWAQRYAALRRVSATIAADAAAGARRPRSDPSTVVRGLAIAHCMRVQAVAGGLGLLGRGSRTDHHGQQRTIARAFSQTMCAAVNERQASADAAADLPGSGAEWDIAQLSVDIDYMLRQLGMPAPAPPPTADAKGASGSLLEAPCYQRLASLAAQ